MSSEDDAPTPPPADAAPADAPPATEAPAPEAPAWPTSLDAIPADARKGTVEETLGYVWQQMGELREASEGAPKPPEHPDAYDIKPTGDSDAAAKLWANDMPEVRDLYKNAAHKAGLSEPQFEKLAREFLGSADDQRQAMAAQEVEAFGGEKAFNEARARATAAIDRLVTTGEIGAEEKAYAGPWMESAAGLKLIQKLLKIGGPMTIPTDAEDGGQMSTDTLQSKRLQIMNSPEYAGTKGDEAMQLANKALYKVNADILAARRAKSAA